MCSRNRRKKLPIIKDFIEAYNVHCGVALIVMITDPEEIKEAQNYVAKKEKRTQAEINRIIDSRYPEAK